MPSRAHVEIDPRRFGVRLALLRVDGERPREVARWQPHSFTPVTEGNANSEPDPAHWLQLEEDDARAIYEALADYFGHSSHDTRALRRDYEHERGRVDTLIAHLVTGGDRQTAQNLDRTRARIRNTP